MLGGLVRAHRQRLGLTQEALAAATGISARTIRDIETGRIASPRPGTVRLLADALGLSEKDRTVLHCAAASSGNDPAGMPADALSATHAGPPPPQPAPAPAPAPAQLPPDVASFTGRGAELARLDALLLGTGSPATPGRTRPARRPRPAPVVVAAVSGTAGVGKTALAVHWAHQARGRFPDGQLYVNLRGYDPDQPMAAGDALAGFLGALGLAGRDIPHDVDDRAARYRTVTAGRRMLVVLDNAATVEQVRPLLPGTGPCAVLVTSRDSLAGLVALHGAHRLDLDLLPAADAHALLRRLVGPRVDAEPDAAAALAAQCVRLPLALRVAAELAACRPAALLSGLAGELADQRRRLDLLDAGGDRRAAVAAVFSWSLRHLPPAAARTFRLLGLHPGAETDAHAVAALTETGLEHSRRMLDGLARAHLVHPTTGGRYGMHDLLRAYAASLATAQDSDEQRRAALGRLFDYYLAAAAAAMSRLHPAEAHLRPRIPPATTPMPVLADPDEALAWLDVERPGLVAAAAHTAAHGWPTHTIRLAVILYRYLDGGHYTDALATHAHARNAAQRVGDQAGEALALLGLGMVHHRLGRYGPAADHLRQALALFQRAGDGTGQARALSSLGAVESRLGRYEPAAAHHRQALALFQRAGDRAGEARALNNLGLVETRLGRYEPAATHHRRALALFRQAGHRTGEAVALNSLGTAEAGLVRYRPAAAHHRQALTLFRQLGDRSGEASALANLGIVYCRRGRPERAAEQFSLALTLFRGSGERDGAAIALNGLGDAARAAGRPADALTHHTEALAIATETGARDQQASAHAGLGHAHHALGDPTGARPHHERAAALYTDLGVPAGSVR
jgi:tetratricopeptide (TPR) repeat protein/transcriptional regulator with XRE-family HTH domain